jgi:hypothetical protein
MSQASREPFARSAGSPSRDVNGADITAGLHVPVHSGDRICVGAWTVITILAAPELAPQP